MASGSFPRRLEREDGVTADFIQVVASLLLDPLETMVGEPFAIAAQAFGASTGAARAGHKGKGAGAAADEDLAMPAAAPALSQQTDATQRFMIGVLKEIVGMRKRAKALAVSSDKTSKALTMPSTR